MTALQTNILSKFLPSVYTLIQLLYSLFDLVHTGRVLVLVKALKISLDFTTVYGGSEQFYSSKICRF